MKFARKARTAPAAPDPQSGPSRPANVTRTIHPEHRRFAADLATRVHRTGDPIACRYCGGPADPSTRAGDRYGQCHRCHDRPALVAAVLGHIGDRVVADAPAWLRSYVEDGTTVPMYATEPDADPDRCRTPWAHLAIHTIDLAATRDRLITEARLGRGGPCSDCGTTFSLVEHVDPLGGREGIQPGWRDGLCDVCDYRRDGGMVDKSLRLALHELLPALRRPLSYEALGFRWFSETPGAVGTRERFGYVDRDTLLAHALEVWPSPRVWHRGVQHLLPVPPTVTPATLQGPCWWCGTTKADTWRRRGGQGITCGPCHTLGREGVASAALGAPVGSFDLERIKWTWWMDSTNTPTETPYGWIPPAVLADLRVALLAHRPDPGNWTDPAAHEAATRHRDGKAKTTGRRSR